MSWKAFLMCVWLKVWIPPFAASSSESAAQLGRGKAGGATRLVRHERQCLDQRRHTGQTNGSLSFKSTSYLTLLLLFPFLKRFFSVCIALIYCIYVVCTDETVANPDMLSHIYRLLKLMAHWLNVWSNKKSHFNLHFHVLSVQSWIVFSFSLHPNYWKLFLLHFLYFPADLVYLVLQMF